MITLNIHTKDTRCFVVRVPGLCRLVGVPRFPRVPSFRTLPVDENHGQYNDRALRESHKHKQGSGIAPGVARVTVMRTTLASIVAWIGIMNSNVEDVATKDGDDRQNADASQASLRKKELMNTILVNLRREGWRAEDER